MRHLAWLALAACGSSNPGPTIGNAVPTNAGRALEMRQVQDAETGSRLSIWLEPGRESSVDTHDPCCGVSYDGNKYDDTLATCGADKESDEDGCGPGTTGVYPGIADDQVCGERRRCVPYPAVRVVVEDGTQVTGQDADDKPLAIGTASVSHRPVVVGREGFVAVTVAGKPETVAVDFGSRYTIVVRGGHIERVTRD
jgi:hypothetical protein